MAQDANSEFERIFGKSQRGSDVKPTEGNSAPSTTQKGPTDSDLLGIRTDSDRFILRNAPDGVPENPGAVSSTNSQQRAEAGPESDNKTHHDAMTIALNVNVFANLTDAKREAEIETSASARNKEKDKQHVSGTLSELLGAKAGHTHSADGPTFVIPLSKEPAKPADASKPVPGASPRSSIAEEFTRIGNAKNLPAEPGPNTEFTRILHVEDKITVAKPNSPGNPPPAPTMSVTSEPKLPATSSEPTVISPPGPSDFTKVVKGSEVRMLQEKLAAAANQGAANPPAWQPLPPNPMAGGGSAPPWQSVAPAPLPQYVPAPGTSWQGSGQSPAMPAHSGTPQPSKLSQYMPLIIALNLLVLIAILLIVFLAVKK